MSDEEVIDSLNSDEPLVTKFSDADHDDQLFKCGKDRKHMLREVRMRSKTPGPPFYMFSKCRFCQAILSQVVSYRKDRQGNIIPVLQAYLLMAGKQVALQTHTYRVVNPENLTESQ